MFKFVAAAALAGVITAVDLQDNTQDLAELEDLQLIELRRTKIDPSELNRLDFLLLWKNIRRAT